MCHQGGGPDPRAALITGWADRIPGRIAPRVREMAGEPQCPLQMSRLRALELSFAVTVMPWWPGWG